MENMENMEKNSETGRDAIGLESKEVGILVYTVGRYTLGINLAKVREITRLPAITSVPYAHPVVTGLFELRNHLIPAVNLKIWLSEDETADALQRIIVAQFMGLRVGFLVDNVVGIIKVPWYRIEPPDRIQRFSNQVLAVIKEEKQLITLIDYEQIILTVDPEAILPDTEMQQGSKRLRAIRKTKNIWILDDSQTIRGFLRHHLRENNYTGIVFFENGKHALETLKSRKKTKKPPAESDRVHAVITDIQMPVMNGYTFIRHLKEDPALKSIPVILFSSLISQENKLKGDLVEVDAQLSKSDSANLVPVLDRLVLQRNNSKKE